MDHLSTRIRARWFVLILALAGLAAVAIVMAQGARGASVVEGEAIYQGTSGTGVTTCALCHGVLGQGVNGLGPSLSGSSSITSIISITANGAGRMPAYSPALTDDQILSTACYVKQEFDGPIPAADEARCGINRAPVADPGGPYTGTVGVAVSFDGSGSSDDHGIVSYAWDFGDGT
ncbi:MAG: PKD domain-containing protein, partial [Acidimicrobiia bacterium]|nr:PKD domain-containing protein [Acidimicrobiia bacterium]